mmetsp:Transcript_1271/g.1322  ORF Transcript_1271/g.1322 Transcript_1271/m.1322 type:complete len:93 (-) Transcript_1271:608-886(-)
MKEWSELEYENYKKKYESSINNYSVFNEKLKELDKETKQNLTSLDQKLNLGYDRSLIMTSEKIQRASVYSQKVHKVLSDHEQIEQSKMHSNL